MHYKDEALSKFKLYVNEVENQLNLKVQSLRSDRGGEYTSKEVAKFCESKGIRHETTAPYSPQQNGLAEQNNRTLVEMVNSMLLSSGLNKNLWGEALITASYILNRIPHKKTKLAPFEIWKERPIDF